jgi:transcriptional regulator with XRE-family HTH domain
VSKTFLKNISSIDTFGSRLRKSRKDRGLSQTTLAMMLGYENNGPVSTMETNKTNPDLKTLARLAESLDIDLHWLITGRASRADRNLEDDYAKLLGSFVRYIAKNIADLLTQRQWWKDHLDELKQYRPGDIPIDPDVIAEHEAEFDRVQRELTFMLSQEPWVHTALERLGKKKLQQEQSKPS